MKTIADAMTEWVLEQPIPDQIKLLQAQDPKAMDLFFGFVAEAQPQLVARFLVWHTDLLPVPVCEVEDCGQVATGQDPYSVRDREVCDEHGEFVAEPAERVA
jgi:hypothetical protein